MTEPIRGKVAQVLNNKEIAINLGSAKGVTVGMYFDVVNVKGENITDPDTGELLGSIKIPKVRVRVTETQEKLSVATTYQTKKVNIGGNFTTLGPFARSLMPPEWITKYETLEKTVDTPDPFDEKDSYVKIGDPVVQVFETEDIDNDK